MFYENLIPFYSPYEEQELLRQFDSLDHHYNQQPEKSNSFYYYNPKQENPSSSSSISNPNVSKKMVNSNVDALSFCHTIYITIQQNPSNPSCPSLTEDSQLLLLPDICCTIPASKLSYIDVGISNRQ